MTILTERTIGNSPFKAAVERAIDEERLGSIRELAQRLDMPDDTLRWYLGRQRQLGRVLDRMPERVAVQIARELGIDPLDVGL